MSTQAMSYARAEKLQDLAMLSSFGFWTVLLGLVPALAYHSLIG